MVIHYTLIMEFKRETLLQREIEIAGFLLKGFSLQQIATRLEVNKKIIKAHIRNMMQKLNAENLEHLIENISSNGTKQPL